MEDSVMHYRFYMTGCLIMFFLFIYACEERQMDNRDGRLKPTDQITTLSAQELQQRELELSKKAADIESLMVKLEMKETELLGKESRLLEYERKLQSEEMQLIEKRKSLERFRMTSVTIMLVGILLLSGGLVLIYKAQQKKTLPGFKKDLDEATDFSMLKKPINTTLQKGKGKKPESLSGTDEPIIDKK
jgi:hypothetical protein